MGTRAWVVTRKGLFKLRCRSAGWAIERVSFLGEPVSMLLPPQASGHMFAALNLGHFGEPARDPRGAFRLTGRPPRWRKPCAIHT